MISDNISTLTTSQVRVLIGYSSNRGVSAWCGRYGVHAVTRDPGPGGENRYRFADVRAGLRQMRGRGYRTDLRGARND